MTAVIHHGAPGSYKTFALVQRILIPALEQGRTIVTNIRGFNDIEKIRRVLGVTIPPSAQIYYVEPNSAGYEQIARFFHWAPSGALIAMDEGQRVYPTRDKNFKHLDLHTNEIILDADGNPLLDIETNQYITRPLTLENAFDQHRHFNWDIYISTPNISKIHTEIRSVVEWAYRHRNVSGLLPWMKNTWVEFRHDAESTGKAVAHYSGAPKKYKADFSIFECYQSTATGTAKQSNENISIFRDPKLRVLLIVICGALGFFIYNGIAAYERLNSKIQTAPAATVEAPFSGTGVSPVPVIGHISDPLNVPAVVPVVNPLADAKIFIVGSICTSLNSASCMLFEVHFSDRRVLTFSYDELRQIGFLIADIKSKYVVLTFKGSAIVAWEKSRVAATAIDEAMRGEAVQQNSQNAI